MPEPLSKLFKGLSTTHVSAVYVLLGGAFWLGELKPRMMAAESSVNGAKDQIERIATTFQEFQRQVADIRADVKVHSVLITSLEGLKTDIKDLRQDLSLTNEKIRTPYKQP